MTMIPEGGGGRHTSTHPMLVVFSSIPSTSGSDYTGGGNHAPDFQNSQFLQFQAQITAYHMLVRTQLLPPQLLAYVGCNTGHTETSAQAYYSSLWHEQSLSNSNHTAPLDSLSSPTIGQSYICVLPHPGGGVTMASPFYVDSLVASQPVPLDHPDHQSDLHSNALDKVTSSSLTTSCTSPVSRKLCPQHVSVLSISAKSSDDQETQVDIQGVLFSLSDG